MNQTTFLNQYSETHDADLIPMLESFINESSGSRFVTMIGMGSHHDYEQRVPAEFQKFKTTDERLNSEVIQAEGSHCFIINGKKRGALNDAYDATILYTDYVIDSMLEKLKDKNALFIYASDHGESFGEEGTHDCIHAYIADDEQIWHIPFLVWASDEFIKKYPQKWKNIKLFEKEVLQNKRMVSHDNIAHTLLDCASIQSDFIDKRFSMCTHDDVIYKNEFEGIKRFNSY